MGEYDEADDEPMVEETPGALPRQWSWNSNTILVAAGAMLAVGFGVYFIVSLMGAKNAHTHETPAV